MAVQAEEPHRLLVAVEQDQGDRIGPGRPDGERLFDGSGELAEGCPLQKAQYLDVLPGACPATLCRSSLPRFHITFAEPASGRTESLSLVTAGSQTVTVGVTRTAQPHRLRVAISLYWPGHHAYGASAYVAAGSSHQGVVITDPAKRLAQVTLDGATDLSTILIDGEPIYADSQDTASTGSPPAIGAVNTTVSSPQPTLCQSLNH